YNLFPAIGAVNAMRSNYNFVATLPTKTEFGSCDMPISDNKVVPPEASRGQIARAYLYMQSAYGRYKMSKQQQQLMTAWDKMYPVSSWECERAKRIESVQGNTNAIMKERCK
ncbi:MAG: endonuclease, partial [Hahellaceae bacterium]|nr:endonuclease [Hahellaceae bacterium]